MVKKTKNAFIQTKQDRMCIFKEILFFQSYVQYKIKQTNHLSFASWILVEGTHSRAFFLPQESNESNWQKTNDLLVCFCTVRSFEKASFLEDSHPVSFCLIKNRPF